MSSEFNAVPVREKYVDFNGKIKDNVPVVLADNRYLMSTTELFEQRMQGRRINRYVNTGDLIAYSGPKSDEQEIKFILTATRNGLTDGGRFALGLINPHSEYLSGAVDLTKAVYIASAPKQMNIGNAFSDGQDCFVAGRPLNNAYEMLQGNGVIAVKRKNLGFLDERLTEEQFLNHKGWRILTRHPDEVPAEFAEDPERAKEYAGKVVFSRYDTAMGMYPSDGEKVPTLRAWCVDWLGDYWGSSAFGWNDLAHDSGRLVGVAPEAPSQSNYVAGTALGVHSP